MANQNLSQFTEKLFVTDADHTFIWDTAASISKRVSRNSWLNSGTLTSDAPVTISQTWNNAAVTFTGLKVNAAGTSGTNSAFGSLLADFQVNGVTQASIVKTGQFNSNAGYILSGVLQMSSLASYGYHMARDYCVTWGGAATLNGSIEVSLCRDGAANTLALRNGAAAQTFNVYGTYTSGTSYERLTLSAPSAANAIIGTNKGSGGGTARGLDLHTDGAARMTISTAGNVGIGTTAPASALHISGALGSNTTTYDSAAALKLTNTTGNSSWLLTSGVIGVVNASFSIRRDSVALPALTISGTDNVGIGTTSPTSKLQVTGGDVEIETVTSGIIMKAAGTATRYRITLNAGGTALVFTPI